MSESAEKSISNNFVVFYDFDFKIILGFVNFHDISAVEAHIDIIHVLTYGQIAKSFPTGQTHPGLHTSSVGKTTSWRSKFPQSREGGHPICHGKKHLW